MADHDVAHTGRSSCGAHIAAHHGPAIRAQIIGQLRQFLHHLWCKCVVHQKDDLTPIVWKLNVYTTGYVAGSSDTVRHTYNFIFIGHTDLDIIILILCGR